MSTRLTHVTLCASEANAPEVWRACLWVGYFIEVALNERGYVPSELPHDAVRFADLWKYHGEQANGGHAQYEGNTEGNVDAWRRSAGLLESMGLTANAALLNDFIEFATRNQDRVRDMYEDGEDAAARELFYGFDDRFAEIERGGPGLQQSMHVWLLKQPWIVIEEREEPASMDWLRSLIPIHLEAEARRAAELRRRHAENHGAMQAFIRRLLGR